MLRHEALRGLSVGPVRHREVWARSSLRELVGAIATLQPTPS
jgi:hypothetical protein